MKRGFGKQNQKKKNEDDDNKQEEEGEKEGAVTIKSLFTFEIDDLTEGRQVTCIDVNTANPDLIAVGYGEYDINCTHEN